MIYAGSEDEEENDDFILISSPYENFVSTSKKLEDLDINPDNLELCKFKPELEVTLSEEWLFLNVMNPRDN